MVEIGILHPKGILEVCVTCKDCATNEITAGRKDRRPKSCILQAHCCQVEDIREDTVIREDVQRLILALGNRNGLCEQHCSAVEPQPGETPKPPVPKTI